ncbi:MAG: flagellar protein FliT [Desulfobacteraceae bacterium]|nr:flagellar protein FliT [Desulfobacteraceae bacterium]
MNTPAETRDSLLTATERCLAMQARHLEGLTTGELSQVKGWLAERQELVDRLRQVFAEAQTSGIDPELRPLLLDRIQRLMEGEAQLFVATQGERNRLGESLAALRRGRRALSGYGPPTRNRPPRFISGQE